MRDLKILKSITNRDEDSLNRYLYEINKYVLLDSEAEVKLAREIKDGDYAALAALTKANLRFVVSVAKNYQHRGIPLSDLISEGNIGLMRAGLTFDETRGFKFISYAVWWIRQAIMTAVRENTRIIRVPVNQQLGMSGIMRTMNKLEQNLEREPTFSELAEAIGKTEEQIAAFFRSNARTSFLEDRIPGAESEELTLLDFIEENNEPATGSWIETESLQSDLNCLLSVLTKREKQVITMCCGFQTDRAYSYTEIAEKLNVCRERVRQIKRDALKRLRKIPGTEYLKDYIK